MKVAAITLCVGSGIVRNPMRHVLQIPFPNHSGIIVDHPCRDDVVPCRGSSIHQPKWCAGHPTELSPEKLLDHSHRPVICLPLFAIDCTIVPLHCTTSINSMCARIMVATFFAHSIPQTRNICNHSSSLKSPLINLLTISPRTADCDSVHNLAVGPSTEICVVSKNLRRISAATLVVVGWHTAGSQKIVVAWMSRMEYRHPTRCTHMLIQCPDVEALKSCWLNDLMRRDHGFQCFSQDLVVRLSLPKVLLLTRALIRLCRLQMIRSIEMVESYNPIRWIWWNI